MRIFFTALIVLFFSAQIDATGQERDNFDMRCELIKLGDIDKIHRCMNREAICYVDANSLSCFPQSRGRPGYE